MKKISWIQKLYIVVIILYLITSLYDFDLVKTALLSFSDLYLKVLKMLVLVFVVMMGTNFFLDQNENKDSFKKFTWYKSRLSAIWLWIIIGWPPYALFPMLKEFKKQWIHNSLLAVFLYNRNVKIPYIPISVLYFWLTFTLILSFYIILFSILNGIIMWKLVKE